MNQMFTTQAFDQTGQFFKEATVPANVQALAEKSVVATRDLYAKTATAVHDSAKALTNVTDLAWANSKMLNEKAAANLTSNLEAAFVAAQAMATAKSLPEISKISDRFHAKVRGTGIRADEGIRRAFHPCDTDFIRDDASRRHEFVQAQVVTRRHCHC